MLIALCPAIRASVQASQPDSPRRVIERTLVVCPANLAFQWQRELKDKFDEQFLVTRGFEIRSQYGVNQWLQSKQTITSLDLAKRSDILASLRQASWDLVIVDEAHRMSAAAEDKKSLRYRLGELLREKTDHYLLLTATPHKGDPLNFSLFLRLLDEDAFADVRSIREAMDRRRAPFYLRRIKEAMVYFPEQQPDGKWIAANGPLRDIHRRVGAAILFESTGVATDKPALFSDLRFALGEPDLDTTSIDTAATTMEKKSFFIRRVGTDGFRIGSKPTMRKIVGDRRAALDETEIMRAIREAVKQEFDKGRIVPVQPLVTDGGDVADSPKLTLVVLDPESEWDGNGAIRKKLGEWTRMKGKSPRFYPAALVWVVRKSGKALREKAELFLAWKRVSLDFTSGTLGADFEESERRDVASHIKEAGEALHDEVWASYRYAVIADAQGVEGLREIDLGAGHSSATGSLSARVVAALKAEGLLNESVGTGYIDRNWPPALKESGSWPLKGLRQAFLDGTLTRLLDPEEVLRRQIVLFVERGDFGLASGLKPGGSYDRVWCKEAIGAEEVLFDDKTYLLTRERAAALKAPSKEAAATVTAPPPALQEGFQLQPSPGQPAEATTSASVRLSLRGTIPPEQWNKLGTKLLPKLRGAGQDLSLALDASLTVRAEDVRHVEAELPQALKDLGLEGLVRIEKS